MSKPTRTITIDDREIQFEEPNWHPLLEFIGEPLIDDFMWMHAVKMPNGREAQAYAFGLLHGHLEPHEILALQIAYGRANELASPA